MSLSRLEMAGFKSFMSPVSLDFREGITAILGPNGCGKTNVVDAVRWVLGEQSARQLRSSKMENVIFNGTEIHKPLGYAVVNMTINNEKGIFPLDYSEITITRKVYRSGISEYFINKAPCRLKDIRELFADTGTGSHSYAVIEQEMVEYVLNDAHGERRNMFEEASGIVKYRMRREEALRKLKLTEGDLVRLEDILDELGKNVRSLQYQVGKTRRYRTLSERIRDWGLILLRGSLSQFLVQKRAAEADLVEATGASREGDSSLDEYQGRVEEEKMRLVELGEEEHRSSEPEVRDKAQDPDIRGKGHTVHRARRRSRAQDRKGRPRDRGGPDPPVEDLGQGERREGRGGGHLRKDSRGEGGAEDARRQVRRGLDAHREAPGGADRPQADPARFPAGPGEGQKQPGALRGRSPRAEREILGDARADSFAGVGDGGALRAQERKRSGFRRGPGIALGPREGEGDGPLEVRRGRRVAFPQGGLPRRNEDGAGETDKQARAVSEDEGEFRRVPRWGEARPEEGRFARQGASRGDTEDGRQVPARSRGRSRRHDRRRRGRHDVGRDAAHIGIVERQARWGAFLPRGREFPGGARMPRGDAGTGREAERFRRYRRSAPADGRASPGLDPRFRDGRPRHGLHRFRHGAGIRRGLPFRDIFLQGKRDLLRRRPGGGDIASRPGRGDPEDE